jgi:hypothetical protein
MARAQGARAQMALAFETVYGTAPASGYTREPFATMLGSEPPLLAPELLGYGSNPTDPIKDAVTKVPPRRPSAPRRLTALGLPGFQPFSPGAWYLIDEALLSADSVSSTVNKTVVLMEPSAPPDPIAMAVAAIETLSGASHKLYPSWSPKAYQKPCSFPPTPSMYSLAAARRSSGFLMSFAHVSGV